MGRFGSNTSQSGVDRRGLGAGLTATGWAAVHWQNGRFLQVCCAVVYVYVCVWGGGHLFRSGLCMQPGSIKGYVPSGRQSDECIPCCPLCCRLSDQGGGIPEGMVDSVWQFGFTTSGTRAGCPARGGSGLRGAGGALLGGAGQAGSSGEGGGPLGEGLGFDTAPPGASFGAAFGAIEGSSRFRIAGALAHTLLGPATSRDCWPLALLLRVPVPLVFSRPFPASRSPAGGACRSACRGSASACTAPPRAGATARRRLYAPQRSRPSIPPHPTPPHTQALALACPSAACTRATLAATCDWSTCPGACAAWPRVLQPELVELSRPCRAWEPAFKLARCTRPCCSRRHTTPSFAPALPAAATALTASSRSSAWRTRYGRNPGQSCRRARCRPAPRPREWARSTWQRK